MKTHCIVLATSILVGASAISPHGLYAQSNSRPTVSVPDFKNTVTGVWWWQGTVAFDLAAALANELQATGDLQVVERQNIQQVLSEQELAELGIVKPSTKAAKKGEMTGAQYIVLGTITSYDSNVESNSSGNGIGFLGFGGRKESMTTKDYVAIDIRIVDSTTGEIVAARTVEGRASNTVEQNQQSGSLLPLAGLGIGLAPNMGRTGVALTSAAGTLNFDSSSSSSNRTPAAKAIRAAFVEVSDYVSCVLVKKDGCEVKYQQQDQKRRDRTRGVLQLDN